MSKIVDITGQRFGRLTAGGWAVECFNPECDNFTPKKRYKTQKEAEEVWNNEKD